MPPDLHFAVESAEPQLLAAAPAIALKLRVEDRSTDLATIQSVLLHCQVRIEPTQRRYAPNERDRLFDLFGDPRDWGRTLRSMLWTHAQTVVPPFTKSITIDLPITCSYDFNIAATKYFHALERDEVPLCLLFSGTVFYHDDAGSLQAAQISWEREATFRLPVATWRAMMDHYYPGSVWLRVDKDLFDRLERYKRASALPLWDQVFARLLGASEPEAVP
ncbi:MAG TPA: DUF6084 family protein [Pirellulales bacterium]|nr:DUF6084 family protein [Pirellulales bacterium]